MTEPTIADVAAIPRRVIAYLIDAFIASGLAIVLGGALLIATALTGPDGMLTTLLVGGPIVVALLLAWFVVYTMMQAGRGSIGMRAQGLRLASARERTRIGFGRALLRNVVFGLACMIVVGYFTPLFDGSGRFQGWHDRAAGALMLNARATPTDPETVATVTNAAENRSARTNPAAEPSPSASRGASTASPSRQPITAAPAVSDVTAAAAAQPRPVAPVAAEAGSLIAFVPGVSREASVPLARSAVQTPIHELDATVHGAGVPREVPTDAPAVDEAAKLSSNDSGDIEDTRISIPGHRLVFTWDDGTRVSVSRRTIFGRNPAHEDGAVVVPVRDETLSLSKTHFEAGAEASGGWVRDRHSTNGMTLVRDGQRIACPAGQRIPVRLGDAIEIGDRIVTIGGYA